MRKIKVSSYDTLHFKILIFLKGKKKKRNDFFLDSHIHIFAYISKYILNVLKKKKKEAKRKRGKLYFCVPLFRENKYIGENLEK